MNCLVNGGMPPASDSRAAELSFVARITPHRARLLTMIGESRTNREIAAALGVSPHTVKREIEVLRELTGCRSKRELARWWTEMRPRYDVGPADRY